MKTLNWNVWGTNHPVTFRISRYANNNNLYIGMITWEEDLPEPWSDLTVNLGEQLDTNRAYIDTNNNGRGIVNWLIYNKLGSPTGRVKNSGFCVYPEFEFNMDKIMEYVS